MAFCLVFVIFRILLNIIITTGAILMLLLQINNGYFKRLGYSFLKFIFLLSKKTLLAIESLKLMLDSIYGFFALETF